MPRLSLSRLITSVLRLRPSLAADSSSLLRTFAGNRTLTDLSLLVAAIFIVLPFYGYIV